MRRALGVAALLLAMSAGAASIGEIKGLKPGMTLVEVKALYPGLKCWEKSETDLAECLYSRNKYDSRVVGIDELNSVAGNAADVWSLMFTPDDRLARITIAMSPSAYAQVRTALTEKFGKPAEEKQRVLQNGFGAKFVGKATIWRAGADAVLLQEFDGSRDTMTVTVGREKLLDQILKFANDVNKKKAKDL